MAKQLRPSQLEALLSGDLNGNEFFALHRIGYNYSLTLGELKKYIGTGGSGGGSDIDLTSVASNIIPDSNGSRILGNSENAWQRLFLTDSIRFINNGIIYGNVDVQGALTLNGKALAMQSSLLHVADNVDKLDARIEKVESAGGVDLSDYYTKQNIDEILKDYLPYMPIDSEPTAGSSNLVTSGGVLSTIAALDEYGEATYLKNTGGAVNGNLTINGLLNIGSNTIRGINNHDILNSRGEWLVLGYGIAEAGFSTYIDGNEIYFRYGTGHATRMKIGSSGTEIYGNLGVAGGIYGTSLVFSNTSGDGLYMSDYSINAHNKGKDTRQLLKFDPSNGRVNLVNGFEANVTSYIGSADNTDYKALLFRRSGNGLRINATENYGYISFGPLNAAKDEITPNAIIRFNNGELTYSQNNVNYHDILTSNSLKIGEYAFQDRTENRLSSTTDLDNVSYGVWGTIDNTTYTNAPVQNFGLIVSRLNQAYKGQLLLPYYYGNIYYRAQGYEAGAIKWGPWRKLAFTDDIPSISGKADKSGYTPNYLIGADANGNIQSTPYQTAKLSYISTLTSNAQDQLNALSSRVNILTAGGIQSGLYTFYKQLTDAEIGMAREVAELAGNPSSDQTVVFNYRQGYFQLANRISTSTAFTVYKKWNGSDKYNRYTTNSNGSITATPREDTLFYNQSVGIQRVAVNSTNNGYVVNTIISKGEIPASFVNAMPLKTIDTTPTLNSSNLITSGGVAKQMAGKQDTISDLDTIISNAANGNTAFGWGNHAIKGYATETYTINKINEIVAAKAGGIPSYVRELSGSGLSNITLVDGSVPPYDVTSASAIYYIVDKGCFYLVISPEAIGQAGRTTKAYPIFDGSAFYNSSATSARKDCLFYNTTTKTVHRIGDSSVLTMVDSGNIETILSGKYLGKNDTATSAKMLVSNSGSHVLYVDGNGYVSSNGILMFKDGSGSSNVGYVGRADNAGIFVTTYGNSPVIFATNSAERLRIDHNGNILIANDKMIFFNHANEGVYMYGTGISWHNSSNAWTKTLMTFSDTGVVNFPNSATIGGKDIIHADNISDYALPKTGGTVDHITTSMLNGYSLIGSSSGLTLSGYFSATRFYEDGTSLAEKYLSKSSDTVTGTLTFNGTSTYHLREASTTPKWYIGKDGYAAFAYVANTSDANMKNLMGDVNLSVNQIANAPARYFTWNNNIQLGRQVGTVAQYWRDVLPEVVIENEGTLGLNYASLAVVSSIILARNIETHEQRIARLEKEIATLTDELNSLVGKP